MRNKKFIIYILVIILLLSFSLFSCGKQVNNTTTSKVAEVTTTTVQPTTTVIQTTIAETTTETTIDESNNYVTKLQLLLSEFTQSMGTISQSFTNMANGTVSISQNKEDTANFIKDMNDIYNNYLSLNVPDKYKTVNQLIGTVMDHITNMDTYLQQYIDTENMNNMTDYVSKAISEMGMAIEYIKKATDQVNSLK